LLQRVDEPREANALARVDRKLLGAILAVEDESTSQTQSGATAGYSPVDTAGRRSRRHAARSGISTSSPKRGSG
jgi:hypothetical protein